MEELIAEVYKHEVLWNRNHARFKDKYLVHKAWDAVTQNTEFTKIEAKKKWRNLRDQFLKELKKIPEDTIDEPLEEFAAKRHCKWRYFKQLSFLKDLLSRKNGYSSEIEDTYSSEVQEDECLDTEDEFLSVGETVVKSDVDEPEIAPQKRTSEHKDANDIKRICLSDDDDYMFFKSLLPYMRRLQPVQKLRIRSKFHDILIQEFS